ncbi:hypothetical protein PCASD_00405 [Puccinia coronata f. sp. avenae]|uniref:Uncharacterized protein n=1 Tax=Puccinia coronata f. sp. avenae TaxID=200324 RepID=A0A2N5VNC9_9BASI|nr:hypothetical protein PCASD_14087 [Puccinia coronata f. sp. avenae]PLW51494.1 hypothetical protein PCASD_00405 [Puccinia coronata f. sp. avenae]
MRISNSLGSGNTTAALMGVSMIFSHWNPVKQVAPLDRSPISPVKQACLTSVPVEQVSLTVPFIELGDPARQLVLVAELCHPAWRLLPVIELGDPARRLVLVAGLGDPAR